MAHRTTRRKVLRMLAGALIVASTWALMTPIERARAMLFVGTTGTAAQQQSYGIFNVKDQTFGALGNGIMLTAGTMSSSSNPTNLSASGASFTSADIGKVICVGGAGSSGAPLVTTIASVTDGTHVVLNANCLTSVSHAIVHYGTDDNTAIQAAVTACYNAGGGIVFFPVGIYIVNGSFQSTSTLNGLITIPVTAATGTSPISIALVGASGPTNNVGCCGLSSHNDPPMATGSIIFTPKNGSGTAPALITCGNAGSTSNFSNVELIVGNLYLRSAYLNSTPLTMVMAQWATYCLIDGVTCDVDATDDQQGATAPVSGGIGISLPDVNNGFQIKIEKSFVTGYDQGIVVGEHADIDATNCQFCNTGYTVKVCYHPIRMGRIGAYRCVTNILCNGGTVSGANRCPLHVTLLATEHSTTGWYQTSNDVVDSGNEIYGSMTYNVIKSVTGYDNSAFSKSGAANFTCTALF